MSSSPGDQQNTQIFSNQSLNYARITSPSQIMSTPSTRKVHKKRESMKSCSKKQQDSDDDKSKWRLLLTKSIEQAARHSTPQKQLSYATQSISKNIDKTADIKNKKGCSYQNMCPICLNKYDVIRGSLQCLHEFCFTCISQWCKTSTICPCCRRPFETILKLTSSVTRPSIKAAQRVKVEPKELVINSEYDYYTCYQCGLGDNEHILLICDECDFYCCHVYCDPFLRNQIPEGDWFCLYCRDGRDFQGPIQIQENEIQTQSQATPQKGIALRTRSRESNIDLRSHLSILRSLRRRV